MLAFFNAAVLGLQGGLLPVAPAAPCNPRTKTWHCSSYLKIYLYIVGTAYTGFSKHVCCFAK